jgi:hypothetical protein
MGCTELVEDNEEHEWDEEREIEAIWDEAEQLAWDPSHWDINELQYQFDALRVLPISRESLQQEPQAVLYTCADSIFGAYIGSWTMISEYRERA